VSRRDLTPFEVVAVSPGEMSVLRNLFQFYVYEEVDYDDPKWGRRTLQRFSIG
jgi:hypothetical protein